MGARHEFCIDCGEVALPRYSRCKKCHRERINERIRRKYKTDEEYRNTFKKRVKETQSKIHKRKPGFYAKKQRDFRKNNPEKFKMIMARTYIRKLSIDQKKEIVAELLKEVDE